MSDRRVLTLKTIMTTHVISIMICKRKSLLKTTNISIHVLVNLIANFHRFPTLYVCLTKSINNSYVLSLTAKTISNFFSLFFSVKTKQILKICLLLSK